MANFICPITNKQKRFRSKLASVVRDLSNMMEASLSNIRASVELPSVKKGLAKQLKDNKIDKDKYTILLEEATVDESAIRSSKWVVEKMATIQAAIHTEEKSVRAAWAEEAKMGLKALEEEEDIPEEDIEPAPASNVRKLRLTVDGE